MSDCIRCHQPVTPGQFYVHAQRDPAGIEDLMAWMNDPPEGLLYQWRSPHVFHVDCPETPTEEAS